MRSPLLRAVTVYGTSNALNKAIPFLLIPVFTRYLTPRDYGLISMFGVILSIMTVVSGLGSSNAITLKYFQRDRIDLAAYVGNCLMLMVFSTAVMALLLMAVPGLFSGFTDLPAIWAWFALAVSASNFVISSLLNLWQSSVRPYQYGLLQLFQTTINIALSLWLIIVLDMGWKGRIHAQWIVSFGFAVIAFFLLRREGWLRWEYNGEYIRNALKIGVPLLPHALGGFIIDTTDRILITNMIGVEDTGIYTVGSQVGMVILFLTGSFNMAWVPWLFGKLKDADAAWKRKVVLATYGYFVLLLGLSLLLSALAPWIFRYLVGESFSAGSVYVYWIALGYAFNGMYMMVTNYVFYVERTYLIAWSTLFSSLVNIVASYALILRHGAIGAAQGAVIAHLSTFLLTWLFSSRAYPMPWSLRKQEGDT